MKFQQSVPVFLGAGGKAKENCFNEKEREFLAKNAIQILQSSPMTREALPLEVKKDEKVSIKSVHLLQNEPKELEIFAESTLLALEKRVEFLEAIQKQMKILQSQLESQFASLSTCQAQAANLSSTMNEAKQNIDLETQRATLQLIERQSKDENLIYNVPKVEELVNLFIQLPKSEKETLTYCQTRQKLCELVFEMAVKSFEVAAKGNGFTSAFDSAFILKHASAVELHKRIRQLTQLECSKEGFNALVKRFFSSRKSHLTEFVCGKQQPNEFLALIDWIHRLWMEETKTFNALFPSQIAKEGEFSRFFYETAILPLASALNSSITASQPASIDISLICIVLFEKIPQIGLNDNESISPSSASFFKRALMVTITDSLLEQVQVLWNQFLSKFNEPDSPNEISSLEQAMKFIQIYRFFEMKRREEEGINSILASIILEHEKRGWTFNQMICKLNEAVEILKGLGVEGNFTVHLPLPPSNKIFTLALDKVVSQVQYTENHTVDL
jgi:hypothetical protein